MRILQVNKFFYLRGGAERHFLELIKLLEAKGNEVIPFAMKDERNLPSKYSKYFPSQVDLDNPKYSLRSLRSAGRLIYSCEAKQQIGKLIKDTQPNIAHLHNIYHQLSPSILGAIKKKKLPIVMTLNDYKLICPNYRLFTEGAPCERCRRHKYYEATIHRCLKNSFGASALATAEMYIHHNIFKFYEKYVDCFIAPSQFIRDKFIAWGWDKKKIIVLPYFLDEAEYDIYREPEDYFVYFGRLDPVKGLDLLLEVMRELPASMKLKIIGQGEEESWLKARATSLGLKNVEFMGQQKGEKLKEIIARARFSILPSIWYEVFGLSLAETNALSRPVIGARLGGIPEVILDGQNGLLFNPGDKNDLKEKILKLWNNPEMANEMGRKGRERVVKKYNKNDYYSTLLTIYKRYAKI